MAKPSIENQPLVQQPASGYIGLRHNEVAIALSRAAAAGEKEATLRGVTFAYEC